MSGLAKTRMPGTALVSRRHRSVRVALYSGLACSGPMRHVRLVVVIGALCAAVTMLAGCGADRQEGGAAPDVLLFTAKTVDGKDFTGESLAGKPVVVWFWASWCPKCRGEASGVRKAAEETAGSVTFLGVAALSDVASMRGFVDRYRLGGFTHVADEDAAVWKRFGVVAQPAYAFVGEDGTVDVVTDRVSAGELLDRARALAGAG